MTGGRAGLPLAHALVFSYPRPLLPLQARSGLIIAAYSRKELLQTGDGHYSPIGGYHAPTDSVLILDVARFKYPPHWYARVVNGLVRASANGVGSGGARASWFLCLCGYSYLLCVCGR